MASKLEEMGKMLDYMEKHKKSTDNYKAKDLLSDLELQVQGIQDFLKENKGKNMPDELKETTDSLLSNIEGVLNSSGTATEDDFFKDDSN